MLNIKTIKYIWSLSGKLALFTVAFWIAETTYFIITEGWHIKATSQHEILCDKIVSVGFNSVIVLIIIVGIELISKIIKKL